MRILVLDGAMGTMIRGSHMTTRVSGRNVLGLSSRYQGNNDL